MFSINTNKVFVNLPLRISGKKTKNKTKLKQQQLGQLHKLFVVLGFLSPLVFNAVGAHAVTLKPLLFCCQCILCNFEGQHFSYIRK